jgi:NAD(P)-dependent dehydrogenase (short-subunit alcohol dehydrogenase family)
MSDGWGPFGLHGKNAVVTGGGHGIGAAIVDAFAQAGARVVVADLDEARANDVAHRVRANGADARAVVTDVADPASCRAAIQFTVDELGSCDVLVNNAGIYPYASLQEVTPELFRKILDVNLLGLTFMSQAAVEAMRAAGDGGSIVNLASLDALVTSFVGLYAYGASKAGVVGATHHMARELGPHGIRVNAIAPGTTMTRSPEEVGTLDGAVAEHMAQTLGRLPLQRYAEPHEMAWIAVFLASSASSYITGATLVADGGANLV